MGARHHTGSAYKAGIGSYRGSRRGKRKVAVIVLSIIMSLCLMGGGGFLFYRNHEESREAAAMSKSAAVGETVAGNESAAAGETVAGNESAATGETAAGNESAAAGETVAGNESAAAGETVAGNELAAAEGTTAEEAVPMLDDIEAGIENFEIAEAEEKRTKKRFTSANQTKVKGIYVTGPIAGSSSLDDLITLLDETELNTMVIDVKNDAGEITWKMNLASAQDMGACIGYITDIDVLMAKLKEHQIYTIARIVCFKDPYLAAGNPELALKKPDGQAVTDAGGMAWVNPCKEEVWEYLTDVAIAAAEVGFDEIQYDYVRFPVGSDADAADYGVTMESDTKEKAITGFLTYAAERLHEKGIVVTADVFGTIIGSRTDVERVGQDYVALGSTIDVLCPMVYPSHYGNHVFGYPVPDAEPYGTVFAALTKSAEELREIDEDSRAIVRPWLQAFTATWVNGHISYEGEQIREQIQAVYDAGYEEWILWNASNRYSADGLLSEEEELASSE